jgi:hypothetical protein
VSTTYVCGVEGFSKLEVAELQALLESNGWKVLTRLLQDWRKVSVDKCIVANIDQFDHKVQCGRIEVLDTLLQELSNSASEASDRLQST